MQVVWELIVMKVSCVIFILCFSLGESQSYSDKPEIISTKGNSTLNTEQKARKWKIKLDVYFNKSLPPVTKTLLGANVLLKCEAKANVTVERYSKDKDGVETSKQEAPPDDIQRGVLNITNVYWSKGAKLIKESTKYSINTTKYDDTIVTILKIEDLESSDAGNYTCIVKQTHEKRQTTKLIVTDEVVNYEIPTYTSLFPNSEEAHKSDLSVQTTPDSLPNMLLMKVESYHSLKEQNQKILSNLQPICQEYTGKQCAHHLAGHYVYIPYYTTQAEQEEKLSKAIQVTRFSNEISTSCKEYALPSLCYSTFPICREPFVSNENFKKEAKEIFSNIETEDIAQIFKNLSQGHNSNKVQTKFKIERLNYRLNSSVLRRVCKNDCIVLENELCQKEYAIAKRHPHIGMQLTLEDCLFLPEEDPDCLTMNIVTIMAANDECYWQDGSGINGGYLGNVSVASNGKPCIKWSKQLQVKPHDHPELAGMHSYCRNPGGMMTQPWCFVDNDGKMEKQLCDIPKCAHKIWIYIVIIFLILTLTIVAFIICFCYKHRYKGNAATIRDINLPNADKNIYGNSRHNSPIEMNELLTNQNSINQPHLTRPNRGNGVLRVPQYSLAQIKFLEELGEGAFGKVYKGALKKNGETQYVAVKALKENASAKTQSDFRREIDLISELSHDNIVCIVGVALKEEPLCMLFEFMARGDLHEFLMGRAPPAGKGLPANRLLNIAHNISSGMQYLASHHYVHRDLAARNCLVSDDFVVKISDFGLSRDIYSSDYYRVQSKSLLPVRWMPPESILYGKFTTESDIWSYGVVLWEIYSYGLQPYYGYSNQEVISMVRGGELLAPPAACPAAMYALMRDCWKHTPQRRPNFEEIVNRLQDWIQMGGCPETAPSDSGSSGCGHRPAGSTRDLQEKVPLLPPHCSSSNGSLATGSLKKFSVAGSSSKVTDDNCSTCSDLPPLAPKAKKHSSGSLIDADRVGRETIVRIPNTHHGNEI